MPLEQSRIAIAPAIIMHPNSKNIPKGPMTSKQLKKAYKERNAAPKMTKAEQRKEEQKIREEQRLELEKEKRLEREKRKREKKREEEAAAKAERKRLGVPEKSKWVRQSQNRITGFIALGKRNREDTSTDADTTRENSVLGDIRPPKNKRLSLDIPDEDSGYASPDHDMDTAMLDVTLPLHEDDVSTVNSQEDSAERTGPKAASQKKARPQISDDELEPVIEQFRSSQLAEAPNFGTIGDAEESSFMSTGRFRTPTQKKAIVPSPVRVLADPFPASQDYEAQCDDMEDTNAVMLDAPDVFTPSKAKELPKLLSQKGQRTPVSTPIPRSATYHDLFGTDSLPKSAEPIHDEIHKTYSPIKSRPNTTISISKPRNPASFEADEDYDSYFLTQPSAPSALKSIPPIQKKTPKKTPKKASQPKARPQISDDETDYDAFFATQKPDAPMSPIFTRKEIKETPPRKVQPPATNKVVEKVKVDPFAASQDYFAMCGDDPFEATQRPVLPVVPAIAGKAMATENAPRQVHPLTIATRDKINARHPIPALHRIQPRIPAQATRSNNLRTMQPPPKPAVVATPKNDPPPSTDYDGFFSPDAPHAKPFQKQQPISMAPPAKPLPQQFEASQDYFAMCGDDEDFDGDITPVLPAPTVTMSPKNLAKHKAYNAKQQAKMKPPARLSAMQKPAVTGQRIGKFVLPVTPNNLAQSRQPLRQVQSAAQNISRPMTAPKFKPSVPVKQTVTSVQRPPQPASIAPAHRHSAPPRPVQELAVADDFEVVSGTQLMRELSEDPGLHVRTPVDVTAQRKETKKDKENGTGQQRQPLLSREQSAVRPPPFKHAMDKNKRAGCPPAKPNNNGAGKFLPAKVVKKTPTALKQTGPRQQKSPPKIALKTAPKHNEKPLPSIEVDDLMDLEIPSNTQVMREIEEEDRARSRSATVVPSVRPANQQNLRSRGQAPIYKSFESDSQLMREMEEEEVKENKKRDSDAKRPPQQPNIRDVTPVCKSFDSNSQILRELAEEEDLQLTKTTSETPCPAQQKPSPTNGNVSNHSLKPLSFHMASDELQTLSQIEREMAEEEAQSKKAMQNHDKTPATLDIPLKPVSFHIASDDLPSYSAITLELAQEDAQAKTLKQNHTNPPKHAAPPPARRMISIGEVPQAYPPNGPNGEAYLMPMPRWPRDRMDMYDLDPMPLSQYEREMAKDDAEDLKRAARRERKRGRGEKAVEKRGRQEEWARENLHKAVPRSAIKPKQPEELNIAEDAILSNSQLMREMEEEEAQEQTSRQPPPTAGMTTRQIPIPLLDVSKTPIPQSKPKSDWLTKTAEQRNAVGSARKGQGPTPPKRTMSIPAMKSVEIEDDDTIMQELAEEEAASKNTTPAPAPEPAAISSSELARDILSRRRQSSSKRNTPFPTSRSTKGKRQFSGLVTPAPEPATHMPPPSTPRESRTFGNSGSAQQAPPSTQPNSRILSSTPLTVKRARKPLFFQEKPEDREESVVFDSKLQADREEKKRMEIEEEQRRQDEWLRQLCSTQAAAEMK